MKPFKPSTLQVPVGSNIVPSSREAYAAALMDAEREYRDAQEALQRDDSNEGRARYAKALASYDTLQGMFPFVAAGAADVDA